MNTLYISWLRENSHPDAKIFVWGHSLGSGVASKLGSILSSSGHIRPTGFVLEAPFSSLSDEIKSFSMSKLIPFDLLHQLRRSNMEFDNVENLKKVQDPVIILHAEDDQVKRSYIFKK